MKLRCEVTDLGVQHTIDHRVHVLVGGQGLSPASELVTYRGETPLDPLALLESENSRPPQRNRPRLRETDIERPEPVVSPNGTVDRLQGSRGRNREPAAP